MPNVIEVVNEAGQRSRMTPKRLEVVREQGWREWTDEDRRAEAAARRTADVVLPTEEEIRRTGVLASVAGDPDAAAAAHEAEEQRDEPDEQLLAALEAIVAGQPADDDTPTATPVVDEHKEA